MDLTTKLRAACGHDSRSVDGCTNCEAADEIERLRRMREVMRATIADDAGAATYQSMGQYRSALLRHLWPSVRAKPGAVGGSA